MRKRESWGQPEKSCPAEETGDIKAGSGLGGLEEQRGDLCYGSTGSQGAGGTGWRCTGRQGPGQARAPEPG